jgi:hypothetical protein
MPGKQIKLVDHLRKTKLNLLTHSSNLYPHDVALAYLKSVCGNRHNGFIITQPGNIEELNEKIAKDTDSNIFAYPYSNAPEDLEYLRYADSVIIFDSLFMMVGDVDNKNDIDNFEDIINTIYEKFSVAIFIVDSSYDQADINKLAPRFVNNISYLSDNAVTVGGELIEPKIVDCKLDCASMTTMQIEKIRSTVKDENTDSLNWTNDKLYNNTYDGIYSPKRFFNVVYPFKVAETIDKAVNVDEGIQLVVNLFGIAEVLKYMPKMKRLYESLLLLYRHCKDDESILARHLIFSGYPININVGGVNEVQFGDYGGDLIYNLLTSESLAEPLYEPSQIIRLYEGDPVENIRKFNSDPNKYKILIANTMPVYAPKGINHFHIMDTNLETAYDLIDVMFKNGNYGGKLPSLDIHLHYVYQEVDKNIKESYDSYDFKNLRANIEKFQQERKMRWDFGFKVASDFRVQYPEK